MKSVLALKVSFDGHQKLERIITWPKNADMAIIGRHAKSSSHRLWKKGERIRGADARIRFSPHSYGHSLAIMLSFFASAFLKRKPKAEFGGRLFQFFSDRVASSHVLSLIKKPLTQSVSFFAIDINALPSHYDVALLVLRARGEKDEELFAVPLVFGFHNVRPDSNVRGGVHFDSVMPGQPCVVNGCLQLSIGESRLVLEPLFVEKKNMEKERREYD